MFLGNRLKKVISQLKLKKETKKVPAFIRVAYLAPRQVVLLTARHNNIENVWPIDWQIPLSLDPPLFGISLTKSGFGTQLVQQSRQFVINYVSASWEDIIMYCGSQSGQKVNKFKEAKLKTTDAVMINAPILTEALGNIECQIIQEEVVGDHILFIGQVIHTHERDIGPRLHHLSGTLDLVKNSYEQ